MSKALRISPAILNRANAGNTEAQFKLAQMYMESGLDEHVEIAEEWALKAAGLGHVEAMYWLGEGYVAYAKDMREEDPEESKTYFEHAHHWLKQAAAEQHPSAILELSNFYRRGDVVEKDVEKSIQMVEQAAKLGEVQAMRDLAFIYANGLGIDANEEKADFWTAKAEAIEPSTATPATDQE